MFSVGEVFCLLLVAILWGGTNPFLKKGTEGIERVQKDNKLLQFLAEVKFLFLNIKVCFYNCFDAHIISAYDKFSVYNSNYLIYLFLI